MDTYMYMHALTHAGTHAFMRVHGMLAYMYTPTHARMSAYTHTYIHTCTAATDHFSVMTHAQQQQQHTLMNTHAVYTVARKQHERPATGS